MGFITGVTTFTMLLVVTDTSHIDISSYGPHWNLGIHAAGPGGAWLALLHRFCQVSQEKDALLLRAWPSLPERWTKVQFQVIQIRQRLRLTLQGGSISVDHPGVYSRTDERVIVRHTGVTRSSNPT